MRREGSRNSTMQRMIPQCSADETEGIQRKQCRPELFPVCFACRGNQQCSSSRIRLATFRGDSRSYTKPDNVRFLLSLPPRVTRNQCGNIPRGIAMRRDERERRSITQEGSPSIAFEEIANLCVNMAYWMLHLLIRHYIPPPVSRFKFRLRTFSRH